MTGASSFSDSLLRSVFFVFTHKNMTQPIFKQEKDVFFATNFLGNFLLFMQTTQKLKTRWLAVFHSEEERGKNERKSQQTCFVSQQLQRSFWNRINLSLLHMFVRLLILLWQCEWYVTSVPVGLGEVVFLTLFFEGKPSTRPSPWNVKRQTNHVKNVVCTEDRIFQSVNECPFASRL